MLVLSNDVSVNFFASDYTDADYYNDEKEKNDMLDQEIFSITPYSQLLEFIQAMYYCI